MVSRCCVFLVCVFVVSAGVVVAAERPLAVSPGSELGSLVESRCPTFSWATVEGAVAHELVLYRVGETGHETEPVLKRKIPGSASSWTPSLDRCPERGGQYAWSVRAISKKGLSEWSSPSLFEVASGPSEAEFEEALAVVQSYLRQEDGGQTSTDAEATTVATATLLSSSALTASGESTLRAPAGDPALQVNGSPVLTEATLIPFTCNVLSYRYLDLDNHTVLDCKTGLIWLKSPDCLENSIQVPFNDGLRNSFDAIAWAGQLGNGQCQLSDNSQPGDWRLPTKEEWEATTADAAALGCTSDGAGAPPSLSNDPGTGCHDVGPTNFFFQNFFMTPLIYWSSTQATGAGVPSNRVWTMTLDSGSITGDADTNLRKVWPVRGGQ